MYQRTKELNIRNIYKHSWRLEIHVEIPYKQQEILCLAVIKQAHLKFRNSRIVRCQIHTQFNFNKLFVIYLIVITFN